MKLIILSLILLSSFSFSQTENDDGFWFGVFTKKEWTEELSYWNEAQFRYSTSDGEVSQLLYRTGILYDISEKHNIGFLFAFIASDGLDEHRFTIQHSQTYLDKNNFKLSSRSRIEARFFEDFPEDSARFRYLLRFDFNKYVTWNEFFFHLKEDQFTGDRVFDRNRFFIGRKAKIFNSKVEYGYLNQYIPRDNQDTFEHLLVLYLFL